MSPDSPSNLTSPPLDSPPAAVWLSRSRQPLLCYANATNLKFILDVIPVFSRSPDTRLSVHMWVSVCGGRLLKCVCGRFTDVNLTNPSLCNSNETEEIQLHRQSSNIPTQAHSPPAALSHLYRHGNSSIIALFLLNLRDCRISAARARLNSA